VVPGTCLDDVERRKILPLLGLELQSLGCPTRSQTLYRLHYPGSYHPEIWDFKSPGNTWLAAGRCTQPVGDCIWGWNRIINPMHADDDEREKNMDDNDLRSYRTERKCPTYVCKDDDRFTVYKSKM
jgi:hypothetical protein